MNFEYEFEYKTQHPDIEIFPMKGIIPGRGRVEIEVTFRPETKTTAFSEVILQISQFDFKPIITKIMGGAKGMEPIRETISRRSYSRGSKLDPLNDSKQMTKQFIKTLENEDGFFGNQSHELD